MRAVLALSPRLALRYPIKKWAAVAALIAGFAYMLLSGTAVATQRSYIMLAIMFVAILLDRPALSMRNLAIAALLILIVEPEAAMSASFQMSFLAVVGLIAFYDSWLDWTKSRRGHVLPAPAGECGWQEAGEASCVGIATTFVAGTLSSIPAAYHFGRISPYSLIANLLAIPVIGLIIMPMAVVEHRWRCRSASTFLPLQIMGKGLSVLLAISDWVSGLSGARLQIPTLPLKPLLPLLSGRS